MSEKKTTKQEAIAIIGMACIFPQAPDITTYWRNILCGVNAIGEPLPEWEADRYLNSNRINTPNGGYLKDLYRFDSLKYGIMPNSVDGGEPDQFLALRVAHDALQDAGYLNNEYDHRDTGIVLGHSTYLHRGQGNLIQHQLIVDQTKELLQAVLPSLGKDKLSEIIKMLEDKLPPFNPDIVPGLVPNVMTGRIANRLNLRGPNYLIDAACSSSLLAVGAAIDELRNGRSRIMLAGGVNASLPAEVSVIFTLLGALSKRGKVRPFETGSDGTLLGEGLGVIVLKRISDALDDGDRVYAVIHGVGQATGSRKYGILAPSVEGEVLAIERAYKACGIDPATIELIEAHGTGIPLGDKTEIAALKRILGERKGRQGSVAIGSVKSMISHCIPAAGIAGIIKSALALHHKILPPTLCEHVSSELDIESTPLYINTTTRPWISQPLAPRRAGINSFGFGGINAHAILEEAPEHAGKPLKLSGWPCELCVFSAESIEELETKIKQTARFLEMNPARAIGDIAAALASQETNKQYRLAMVVKDTKDFAKKIGQTLKRFKDNSDVRWATRNGIIYSTSPLEGKLAFVFPGEGSQYINMLADLALFFDEIRSWFDFWRGLYKDAPGDTRTDIVFPPPTGLTEQRRIELEERLHTMDVGSEAVFIGGQAMHTLLRSFGVKPDVMVGHSSGESSALAASGAIASDDLSHLADFILQLNKIYQRVLSEGKIPTGALLTVGALSKTIVEQHIASLNKEIVIAMENCPNQLVLYGAKDSIEALQNLLISSGGICIPLPFDRGYHTPQFSAVSDAFLNYYKDIGLSLPSVPLYSCATADLFPKNKQGVRKLAAGQWSKKVRFEETVKKMYEDGVRFFIEVGPSGNLSAFISDILSKKEYLSLATNQRQKNSVEQLLTVLAHLYVNAKELQLEKLFGSRSCTSLNLQEGLPPEQPGMRLSNTMPLIHLTDENRTFLQEILAGESKANHNAQTPFPPVDSCNELTADNPITADYFNHMRNFLDQQHKVLQNPEINLPPLSRGINPVDAYIPFSNSIVNMDKNQLEGRCRLSVLEDNFLKDHVLSGSVSQIDPELFGLSCVPLMVSLEIMAEACALLADTTAVKVIENVKAFDWIALDDGEVTLDVRAERLAPDQNKYHAQILNAGNLVVSADFSFDPDWHINSLPELKQKQAYRWEGHELYIIGMFHGPMFQSIHQINGWNTEGIDANLSKVSLNGFYHQNAEPDLVLNPVLLDALGQLSAYWIAQQAGTDFNCFPSTIERIEFYSQCPQNMAGLTLRARQQLLNPAVSDISAPRTWQFECLDSEGHPLLRATNLVNIYFSVPNRFYEFRRSPLNGWLGQLNRTAEKDAILLWQLPHFTEKFCIQSNGIFLRILAHAFLNATEREEWQKLAPNIKVRSNFLFGRACIKEAVRFWIFQQTGQLLYPTDITVLHDEKGAPYVDGWWNDRLILSPEISLSHDKRQSLVAIAPPRNPVGVDIEQVGRIQRPDLLEKSYTDNERILLREADHDTVHEKSLRIWCAKEAAAKYMGSGLQGMPENFEVSFIDDTWELAYVQYLNTRIEVSISYKEDMVLALATKHAPSFYDQSA